MTLLEAEKMRLLYPNLTIVKESNSKYGGYYLKYQPTKKVISELFKELQNRNFLRYQESMELLKENLSKYKLNDK